MSQVNNILLGKCDLLQGKGPCNFAFPTEFRRSQLSLTVFQRF